MSVLPSDWMPEAQMKRIICHWTAGAHEANETDLAHYHFLIEGSGRVLRGKPSIKLNEAPLKPGYAAHTRNCNTGSIGVSLCCMAGATETPFDSGIWPMLHSQWLVLLDVVACLCIEYDIPVSPTTVLSHAEVPGNLGIAQAGKWDYTRLSFDLSLSGARACGNLLRSNVFAKLSPLREPSLPNENGSQAPLPDDTEVGTVTASSLNFRSSPNGEIVGSVPKGIQLMILLKEDDWLKVTTPAGYTGWVHGNYVER